MAGQRLGPAQAYRLLKQRQRIKKTERSGLIADDIK